MIPKTDSGLLPETQLLIVPATNNAIALLVLAHGAGAPMDSEYMNSLCQALALQGISTARFEFPYMLKRRSTGTKSPPDRQPKLLESWRQAYIAGCALEQKKLPVWIGGKSMGGRMASLLADELQPAGLCCFGFPFFPPAKLDINRVEHFKQMQTNTLILQGTRDAFGKPGTLDTSGWSAAIQITWINEGDHDLKPTKKSGLTQQQLIEQAAATVGVFVRNHSGVQAL